MHCFCCQHLTFQQFLRSKITNIYWDRSSSVLLQTASRRSNAVSLSRPVCRQYIYIIDLTGLIIGRYLLDLDRAVPYRREYRSTGIDFAFGFFFVSQEANILAKPTTTDAILHCILTGRDVRKKTQEKVTYDVRK